MKCDKCDKELVEKPSKEFGIILRFCPDNCCQKMEVSK